VVGVQENAESVASLEFGDREWRWWRVKSRDVV
jgi:hypothetical protein